MQRRSRQQVLEALRVALDELAPAIGDRLPAERELAAMLGCSRETLRLALEALEAEKVVWRHVGQGTFRGKRPLTAPVRDNLPIEIRSVKELMRARVLIEPVVAREAARRATDADVRHLRACVDQCRHGADSVACERADSLFHASIARVAGNAILLTVLKYLSDTRRRSLWQREWDRTYRRLGVAEFTGEHSDQHEHVVDAIAERDDDAAQLAMQTHLETIDKVLMKNEAAVR